METSTLNTVSSRSASVSRTRTNFYLIVTIASFFIVIAGFSLTYLKPMISGSFSARPLVHIHGIMYFAWMILFVAQAFLVKSGNTRLHKRLGIAGFCLAAGMIVAGVAVAITGAQLRSATLSAGGLTAKQFLIVPLTDMILFATFLSFSLANLKNPETHKRLMILATVSLLPAAFGRLMPITFGITNPFAILLAEESILLAGILYDIVVRKKIHPVYYWAGGLMVIIHLTRFPMATSDWWAKIADWLVG